MSVRRNGRPITRGDIEAAFERLVGEGEKAAASAVPAVVVIAGAAALAVVALSYLAGKRRGRRTSSVVEVRRL